MKFIEYICPNCGATVQADDSATEAVCLFCSEKFAVSEAEKAPETQFEEPEKENKKAKKEKKSKEKKSKKKDKKKNAPESSESGETAETNENAEGEAEEKKKSKGREVFEFVLPIVIAFVVAMLLKTFVFANAVVPTGSMLNTIQEGDRIIASRIEYNFHEPERYDIIIFKAPDEAAAGRNNVFYVKRVIGLPGETVTVVNGVVYVQGKDGKSEQLRDDFITACEPTGNFGPYVVPEDSYFVMGDNRESSVDSRYWTSTNYVHKDLIIGKAKFCYFPFNDAGLLE